MKTITHAEKMFLSHIIALSNSTGYCYATNRYLRDFSNYSDSSVHRILRRLSDLGLIMVSENGDGRKITPMVGGVNLTPGGVPEMTPIESKEERTKRRHTLSGSPTASEPFNSIIVRLNEKAHTSYRPGSKDTRAKIQARLNEGFVLEDFCAVIDHKCKCWLTDEKMMAYLRPLTLFGPKFEGYLQEARNAKAIKEHEEIKRSETRDARAPSGRF